MSASQIDHEIARVAREIDLLEKTDPECRPDLGPETPHAERPSSANQNGSNHSATPGGNDHNTAADQLLVAKVRRAMKTHNLTQAQVATSSGIAGGHTTLSAWLNDKPVPKLKAKEAQLVEWLGSLTSHLMDFAKGDVIEAKDSEGMWYQATVKNVKRKKGEIGAVMVHYKDWSSEYDEWIEVEEGRLAVLGTHTQPTGKVLAEKKNLDNCLICGLPSGELLLCDGCPAAYHGKCFDPPVNMAMLKDGAPWYCPDCEDKYKRVPVWCPGKSGVVRGDKAPFKKDLTNWLQENPGWEIWDVQSAMKRQQ